MRRALTLAVLLGFAALPAQAQGWGWGPGYGYGYAGYGYGGCYHRPYYPPRVVYRGCGGCCGCAPVAAPYVARGYGYGYERVGPVGVGIGPIGVGIGFDGGYGGY